MVAEIRDQLNGERPDVVVVSVGGGGLMVGVARGLESVGWSDVRIVAVETIGAESLNACVAQGLI